MIAEEKRDRDSENERRKIHGERLTKRNRHKEADTVRHTHRARHRETDTERHTQRARHSGTDTYVNIVKDRHLKRQKDKYRRSRDRQTDKDG